MHSAEEAEVGGEFFNSSNAHRLNVLDISAG